MFEQLFSHSSTVRLHREAPMAQEREAFLLYLHERGICRTSLRTFAALLNQIVRFLRLKTLRDVKDSEIESAARKWAKCRHPKRGRGPGPCTKPYFKWFAKRWLRFHGKWIPTPPPRQPFAGQLRDFEQYMKTEMGLSRETVQGRVWKTAKFLRWYSSQRKSLRRISLRDVDKYFAPQAKHLANVALASVADALRAFFQYAERRSWCEG